jgi:hypothetical protein
MLACKVARTIKKSKVLLQSPTTDGEDALNHHIRGVKNWSSEISFADLCDPKSTSDVFVPLDVYLHPRRRHVDPDEISISISHDALLNQTFVPVEPQPEKHASQLGTSGQPQPKGQEPET